MLARKKIEEYILALPNVKLDFPFGEDVAVYKVFIPDRTLTSHVDAGQGTDKQTSEAHSGAVSEHAQTSDAVMRDKLQQDDSSAGVQDEAMRGEWKMFALVPEKREPLQVSLKCDPQLAVLLREKYESVMEGYHLNKKHWNTILLTGQLPDEEIQGLITHSYNLVIGLKEHVPTFDK